MRYLRENGDKRTRDDDIAHLRKLDPFLAEEQLQDISMDALWPFIHQRREADGVSNATVNRALEVVRRILHLARDEWGWIQRFPRILMLREPKRRIRFLTRQEADQLIGCLPDHLRPVVRFALATGCRMREILTLEWSRVDWERQVGWLDPGTTKNGEGQDRKVLGREGGAVDAAEGGLEAPAPIGAVQTGELASRRLVDAFAQML